MQIEFFSKVAMTEDKTDLETQQKIKALKSFLMKHHRHVRHLTKEVANFEREEEFLNISELRARSSAHVKESVRHEQVHSSARAPQMPTQNTESAAALEQHCDAIQNMMATFISSLKTAKENIMLFDQPTSALKLKQVPLCTAKCKKEERPQHELPGEKLHKQKKKRAQSQSKLVSSM